MHDLHETSDYRIEASDHQQDRLDRHSLQRQMQDSPVVSDQGWRVTDVDLNKIILPTDLPPDFGDPQKYNALCREAQMLGQMQPALSQGANVEMFHGWDQANQIGHYSPDQYVRGYADVYHSYHGDEAVALDPKPDGTYDILNGRHRVVAARDVGLFQIPARIVS